MKERGGPYYTRSKKVDGRVVREYLGGGTLGLLAAQADAEARHVREKEAVRWRAEKEDLEALDAPVEELSEAAETLARAVLLASGYRQHKRGEWRKRRGTQTP